jgi:hypothetical protein
VIEVLHILVVGTNKLAWNRMDDGTRWTWLKRMKWRIEVVCGLADWLKWNVRSHNWKESTFQFCVSKWPNEFRHIHNLRTDHRNDWYGERITRAGKLLVSSNVPRTIQTRLSFLVRDLYSAILTHKRNTMLLSRRPEPLYLSKINNDSFWETIFTSRFDSTV